jgi:hypothetical protein
VYVGAKARRGSSSVMQQQPHGTTGPSHIELLLVTAAPEGSKASAALKKMSCLLPWLGEQSAFKHAHALEKSLHPGARVA